MKVVVDVDVEHLRKIAILLLNKTRKEIREMTDEDLVLESVRMSTYGANSITIIKGEES